MRWLLANHRGLIEAELAINEGGGGEIRGGRHTVNRLQTSEKVPINFRLEVTNPGGHSSRPRKDNAIYQLAEGLVRLGAFEFPVALNDTTRLYFERTATQHSGQLADDMRAVAQTPPDPAALARLAADTLYNSTLRTTCVATRLEGGHASNALPQTARATVNCRVLPGEKPEDVQATLVRVLASDKITVTATGEFIRSDPSPISGDLMGRVERITTEMWPGALVIPSMSTGATDSRWLRNAGIPSYGVSGIFYAEDSRAHGQDERVSVAGVLRGADVSLSTGQGSGLGPVRRGLWRQSPSYSSSAWGWTCTVRMPRGRRAGRCRTRSATRACRCSGTCASRAAACWWT